MEKQYFIYITTNNINGKQYIGQHKGYETDNYLGSGVELTLAIKKYGKENFSRKIICFCKNQKELDEKEYYYINKYDAVKNNNFYNIAEGGCGGNKCAGLTWKQEQARRKKISEAMRGEKNPFYGKSFPKEKHPMYGKHHTKESKEKMRQAKVGKKLTEEHKKKISLNSGSARKINMYDKNHIFIKQFRTLKETNIFLKLSPNSTCRLREAILNKKLFHNYYFTYNDEEPVSTILKSEE